jgi:hypothetical protein
MLANYSVQDIFGSVLTFLFFSLVFVFPGYVCAWAMDLFEFRRRLLPARLTIAVVISMAISPVLLFLAYRLGSAGFSLFLLGLFGLGFVGLVWADRKTIFKLDIGVGQGRKLAAWIFGGWSLLAIASLVDIQWGKRLYFSMVAFDFTSRVSIIAAITRTGVPPVNPGYFTGEAVRLTFLYYFWYIPCSLIDQLCGKWVDARMALIASVAWSGIGLMCVLALYLRLRNPWSGARAWKSALLGIGALTISGLDIYPALIFMLGTRFAFGYMWPVGDMEHWNERITAWTSALLWAPHHVAGLIVCLVGFLLIQHTRGKSLGSQLCAAVIAGLAFASATGLSIWMTATFVFFWVVWMSVLFFHDKEYRTVMIMALAGVVALVTSSPFLFDLLHGSSSVTVGSFPVVFQVRAFTPLFFLLPFMFSASAAVQNLVNLIFLPLNYFLELGFYLVVAWLWLRRNAKNARREHAYYVPEMLLFGTSVFVGTFMRSTVIAFNDLGWRSWLFGQFILLIWALDIGQEFLAYASLRTYLNSKPDPNLKKPGQLLAQLLMIGILTTVFSLTTLRTWGPLTDLGITGVPSFMSPDTHLGERTFAAREAYEYIRDNLPEQVIVQYNPVVPLDRPAGLYGSHQMVAADLSSYGVPTQVLQSLQLEVGSIFQDGESDWAGIDRNCKQHYIDVIILNDLDPVWRNLSVLISQRRSLYNNSYYAVFACGKFAGR